MLAIAAAVFGALAGLEHGQGVDPLGLAAALAFTAALSVEIWLLAERPEHAWYDGRALAESAKTIAWRFAVGGQPFPAGLARPEVSLAEQLADVLHDSPTAEIVPTTGNVVSRAMAELRASPLTTRMDIYIEDRIADQQRWYARKAEYNDKRSSVWKMLLITVEMLGVLAGLATAYDVIRLDLTSIISTGLGVGVAWLALKQHESLTRAYALASHELALIGARLRSVTTEDEWAAAVADAEEAISREHTMWRAARVVDEPRPHASSTSHSQ